MPEYKVEIYRTAELTLKGKYAFYEHDSEGEYPYAIFVWVIRGAAQPILVDTGPRSIEEINRGVASLVVSPVTQRPGEDIRSILDKARIEPTEVSHVFFTHMHYDHISNVHLFPNAKIVASKLGFEEGCRRAASWIPGEVLFPMQNEWNPRVVLVHEEEVLPGIRTIWLGGHTPCSMGIAVDTALGTAIITGDVISLYANMETPIGVFEDLEQVRAGMRRIREEADIVLPSHDPEVLNRFPGGIVG